MARLHRPYIPLDVRVQVAQRQLDERGINSDPIYRLSSDGARLKVMLSLLFGDRRYALDHDPALVNRQKRLKTIRRSYGDFFIHERVIVYSPPANDPNFLIYREAGKPGDGSDHDIKTRVRGPGARLSDLAEARKAKRVAKNRERGRGASPASKSVTKARRRKRKETFREFERRFDRGDPTTIDRKATAAMSRFRSSTDKSTPKMKSANRWPPRGSQKIRNKRS